jgi:hypothetical protein
MRKIILAVAVCCVCVAGSLAQQSSTEQKQTSPPRPPCVPCTTSMRRSISAAIRAWAFLNLLPRTFELFLHNPPFRTSITFGANFTTHAR